jgi:UDP-glucose:(glucosyl)LPS alpha-1,2-glucosyltransferase
MSEPAPSIAPRIAIVLPPKEGFSAGAVGGVGLMVHRLARSAGGTVFGIPRGKPFADVDFRPIPQAAPWPWLGSAARRYAASVARALAAFRPALIEVHNRPEIALALARRCTPAPVLLVLHNDPQGMRGARTETARAALMRRMAGIACVSGWVRERLLDGVAAPDRAPALLPNCIDLAALPASLADDRRDRTILFAGRVVADKGADAFVRACARALPALDGWRAEMIGADRFFAASPETDFLRQLRPVAAKAGVTLAGYQPHDAVLAAMGRAAIAVVPSRWPEPFGLTALEAMASGAALICSDRGALPEVAGEAALYIDPDKPDRLAQAITELARTPARRAALAEAGRARARQFDVTAAAAHLSALRQEILRP